MFKLLLTIILIYFSTNNSIAHPLHLTVTNIDIYNDSINVEIKIFQDDLSSIIDIKDSTNIIKYTSNNLQIIIDSNIIHFYNQQLLISDNNIIIIFKTYYNSSVNKITIINTLLSDTFGDQRNMVIINYMQQEKGIVFSNNTTQQTIHF